MENKYYNLLFPESKKAFEVFYEKYNIDKPLRDQLRSSHYEVYIDLMRQYRNQLIKGNKTFTIKDHKPPIEVLELTTNRVRTAKRLKKSKETVGRCISRLIDSGVIKNKVNHGRLNFEIEFCKDILVLQNIATKSYFYRNSQISLLSNCHLFTEEYKFKKNNNNLLTEIDKENPDFDVHQFRKDFAKKGSCKESDQIAKENQDLVIDKENKFKNNEENNVESGTKQNKIQRKTPQISPTPPEKTEITKHISKAESYRISYSIILFLYAIEKIPTWKGRVNMKLQDEITKYIEENYFNKCYTIKDFDTNLKKYQWFIDKSRRIILNKIRLEEWKQYNVMPSLYFDVNYTKGFRINYEYYKEYQLKKQKKHLNIKRLDVNDKINKQIFEYYQNPNDKQYRKCLEYIKSNIPSRLQQFIFCIKNKKQKVENYFNK